MVAHFDTEDVLQDLQGLVEKLNGYCLLIFLSIKSFRYGRMLIVGSMPCPALTVII